MATTLRPVPPPRPAAQATRTPEVDAILSGCPVLRAIVDRAARGEPLEHGQVVALRHSVGHLPAGPRFVNGLLRGLPGTRPDQLMGSPLSGAPISCAQLRRRAGGEDAWACADCDLPEASEYPTPLLYAGRPRAAGTLAGGAG